MPKKRRPSNPLPNWREKVTPVDQVTPPAVEPPKQLPAVNKEPDLMHLWRCFKISCSTYHQTRAHRKM